MQELEIRDRSNRLPTSMMFQVKRVLIDTQTAFQHLTIVEIEKLGRCLFLDGLIQSCEADEFIYHEALVRPAMDTRLDCKTVLIGGGGEGCTLREVLRYSGMHVVDVVDIDQEAVELQQRWLGYKDAVFHHRLATFHYLDINEYLRLYSSYYDIIILDLTTEPTENVQLIRNCRRHLSDNSILVTHAGPAGYLNYEIVKAIAKNFQTVFRYVILYREYIPCFFCDWGFVMGSDSPLTLHNTRLMLPPYLEM